MSQPRTQLPARRDGEQHRKGDADAERDPQNGREYQDLAKMALDSIVREKALGGQIKEIMSKVWAMEVEMGGCETTHKERNKQSLENIKGLEQRLVNLERMAEVEAEKERTLADMIGRVDAIEMGIRKLSDQMVQNAEKIASLEEALVITQEEKSQLTLRVGKLEEEKKNLEELCFRISKLGEKMEVEGNLTSITGKEKETRDVEEGKEDGLLSTPDKSGPTRDRNGPKKGKKEEYPPLPSN